MTYLLKKIPVYVLGFFLCATTLIARSQNPKNLMTPVQVKKSDTLGQRDLIDIGKEAFHIQPKKLRSTGERKVYYSLLPTTSSVPGGGLALITSTTAGFYLGDRHHTYMSNVSFSPYFTFSGKYVLSFRSNIWLQNNGWNFQGDTRFTVYPQYTWGIGGGAPDSNRILINYGYIRFYHVALKRIKPWLMAGIGYDLDYHINIRTQTDSIDLLKYTGYPYGTTNHQNSFSSGITFNVQYDTRNNSINPLPGMYANIKYRINPRFLGSTTSWKSLLVDVRKYIPFSRHEQNVLAVWSYLWTALGSDVPYLDMPALGWDSYQRSGRGFDQGRYIGKTLYYLETEYRRDITNNGLFGYVVFANLNSVTEQNTHRFEYLHPGGGAGLRIKFNKRSGTNISIDYGISKDFKRIYFNLGEAF